METQNHISKIQILVQQKKYVQAEQLLRELLAGDHTNADYLAMLAEINIQQDKHQAALLVVNNAIGYEPDNALLFYIRARAEIQLDRFDDAERDLKQALELDPYDADFFALLGQVKLARKQFEQALQLAEEALAIDAENLLALNTRSSALLKLNRKQESFATIEGALREDPENAFTHTNYGWGLLEKGDHRKALEHFKEALQKDPDFSLAQSGLLEALKARSLFYRLYLKYSFFMGKLSAKGQWAVLIGFFLGVRVLRAIAQRNEAWQPYLIPVIVGLTLLAFSTWVINPIGNLFLRLNKYGRLLLDKKERWSANFVGLSLLLFLAGIALFFALSDQRYLTLAVFGFLMMVPCGSMLSPAKSKYVLPVYTAVLAAIGVAGISLVFIKGEIFNIMTAAFLVGFFVFQWVANFILIKEDNV